ncbi:hypothetical protein [Myxococcus xanthus]|nr:hypothetical protein [Myxococcus xanthus]
MRLPFRIAGVVVSSLWSIPAFATSTGGTGQYTFGPPALRHPATRSRG